MKAILTRKSQTYNTAYGQNYGGKTDGLNPTYFNTDLLENVTNVTIVTEGVGAEFYAITHKTGSDTESHVTRYGTSLYNILITGG